MCMYIRSYIIVANINYRLSISCNTFVTVMEYLTVKTFASNSGSDMSGIRMYAK